MRTTPLLLAALLALLPAVAGADTFEPNDTVGTAHGPLLPDTPVASYIGSDGDIDWFYFDAAVGDLSISLTNIPAGTDYDLYLTDEQENIFAESYNSDNEDELITGQVTSGGRFWIRVEPYVGFSDTHAYTLTVSFTPVNTDPVVEVLAPNGGETFTAGTPVDIQWSASDAEDGTALDVDLAYSTNNGASWTVIATGLVNDGSHSWTVPAQTTAQGLIRATATDGDGGSASDASDTVFSIQPGVVPELVLSLPQDVMPLANPTLELPVTFSSNVPVGALQFAVTFNSAVYIPLSVEAGPLAGSLTMETNLVADQVRVVFYSTQGIPMAAGSGELCTVRLDPSGWASHEPYGIVFADVVASDPDGNELPVVAVDAGIVAVRGVSLLAEAAADGVRLAWTAEADGAHAGFRVLREDRGQPVRLHEGLLAADARGYTDRTALPGRTFAYWLEAVERDGSTQRFGPVEVFVGAGPLWAGVPFPNPSRETVSLEVRRAPGTPARAVVVDLSGRVVRELEVPVAGTIAWDGRLRDGSSAPAGVYFLHLRQDGQAVTRRVVRLAGR